MNYVYEGSIGNPFWGTAAVILIILGVLILVAGGFALTITAKSTDSQQVKIWTRSALAVAVVASLGARDIPGMHSGQL